MCFIHTGGLDYKFKLYNVTFPAGVTNKSVVIDIVDDKTFEADENFYLHISNSLPDNVTLGDAVQTTITIMDNESG